MKKTLFSGRSPRETFSHIREQFAELGLIGRDISIEHEGCRYKISCDDENFMVYRINKNSGLRHHVPGWPVCLVNSQTIFEECSAPALTMDHFVCPMTLENWLEIVRHQTQQR